MSRPAVAVDWSGAAGAETAVSGRIWVAEAVDGVLVALEPASRVGAVDAVLDAATRHGNALVAGLDFSFSYPAWFMVQRGFATAPALWAGVEGLAFDAPPFYGWKGSRAPAPDRRYRRTEAELRAAGLPAKSTFQVAGPGSVGTGTRRGLPHLARLAAAGCAIWPFGPSVGCPSVVEVYPRAFTGPVVKSSREARTARWDELAPPTDPVLRERALSGEDAFDAALTALGLGSWYPPDSLPGEAGIEGWAAAV